ncbi:Non-specific serine/threonine protein kinase [Bertholletia excelsa]
MTLDLLRAYALFLLLFAFARSHALSSDGSLLLSFKYSVLSDPLAVLDNWNCTDDTPCSWTGVTCSGSGDVVGKPEFFRVIDLSLPNSQLLGSIPEKLGLIKHLRTLDLSGNFLNGTLPKSLFNISHLQVLSLSDNSISGELPDLGLAKGLKVLNLSGNALAGRVPESLASSRNLTVVSLRGNYFSGSVPSGFNFVEVLDLSSNLFNGSLPVDLGGEDLKYLNLSHNKFSGSVSPEFAGKIPANASIDLSYNNLAGIIPESVALLNQKTESFAGNKHLCGKPLRTQCVIPSTLSIPPNDTSISSSPAIAAIPRTANGPETSKQNKLKPGVVAGITAGDLAGIGILVVIFVYIYRMKKKKSKTEEESTGNYKNEAKCAMWPCLEVGEEWEKRDNYKGKPTDDIAERKEKQVSFKDQADDVEEREKKGHYENKSNDVVEGREKQEELVLVDGETEMETEMLLRSSAYVLGSSGETIVYKAVMEDGTAVAVRRIGGSGSGEERNEFEKEVRAVAKLRHENLVRVRGFYWGEDEKLVISDYLSGGSLASALGYNNTGCSSPHLPFEVRLKIARGVARGLTYLHQRKRMHGNIKPSNILLSPDMCALIADFGLHRFLSTDNHRRVGGPRLRLFGFNRSNTYRGGIEDPSISNTTPTKHAKRTSGYNAPESLQNCRPNPSWDIYSFGVVLLELLTRKVFSDRELSRWTVGSVEEEKHAVLRMADVAVWDDVRCREDAVLACFELGFRCASLVPRKRPCMKEALHVLEELSCQT